MSDTTNQELNNVPSAMNMAVGESGKQEGDDLVCEITEPIPCAKQVDLLYQIFVGGKSLNVCEEHYKQHWSKQGYRV